MQLEVGWKRVAMCAMVFALHARADAEEVDPLKRRWVPV